MIFSLSVPVIIPAALTTSPANAPDVGKAASAPTNRAIFSPDFTSKSSISTCAVFASCIAASTFSENLDPPRTVFVPLAFIIVRTPSSL